MTNQSILGTLTALTLACSPAAVMAEEVHDNGNITVSALRERVIGRAPGRNAPIVLYTASVRVNVGDLDLRGAPGWDALHKRVQTASWLACDMLDFRTRTSSTNCRGDATRAAMRAALPLRFAQAKPDALVFTVGKS
jgi:UrcA family protein